MMITTSIISTTMAAITTPTTSPTSSSSSSAPVVDCLEMYSLGTISGPSSYTGCDLTLILYSTIFDGGNIDGHHLRPPVLATLLLGVIERENFDTMVA